MDDTRLGSILLESKVISEVELEKCLEVQALTGNTRTIGQILLAQFQINAPQSARSKSKDNVQITFGCTSLQLLNRIAEPFRLGAGLSGHPGTQ